MKKKRFSRTQAAEAIRIILFAGILLFLLLWFGAFLLFKVISPLPLP